MKEVLGMLYSLIFICYVVAVVFVLFHLLRYSLNKSQGLLGAIVFAAVAAILLFTNALLFLNLPFEEMFALNAFTL